MAKEKPLKTEVCPCGWNGLIGENSNGTCLGHRDDCPLDNSTHREDVEYVLQDIVSK